METLPASSGLATGRTSPQGVSGGTALRGPKKLTPVRNVPDMPTSVWSYRCKRISRTIVKKEKQMTAEQSADASFHKPPNWGSIDWTTVRELVRRLQMRIAKATQSGHHRKAQSLQWLLTHSWAAKLLAVRTVTANKGAKTPGVDNKLWRTDKQKLHAAINLKRHGYKPSPLRRHYIPKKNGKLRPLSIPTMHDRAMQALHAFALAPIAETLADQNSYGFRLGRRCADALAQCFIALSTKQSAQWVLEADIRACFDEISHEWLLQHIPMDKQMLHKWLSAGYWEKDQLFPTSKGTPQGGIISPILANLTLDGLEKAIRQAVRKQGDKVNFVRYADDFIVTGATREILEQKVKPAVTAFLQQRGLELSEQKTVITHIQDGFNFLGHTVRKYGDKLLIKPAKRNIQDLQAKISQIIQSALGLSQEALIRKLNPPLRGWANYFRNAVAKRTFSSVDHYLFQKLWLWAKRRHPTKSATWKRQRYFTAARDGWNFSVRIPLAEGKSGVLKLYGMAQTRIERHIKVRGAANPFDPAYTDYFDKRRCFAGRVLSGYTTHELGSNQN
jgi:RNA-directed DNA polymerase